MPLEQEDASGVSTAGTPEPAVVTNSTQYKYWAFISYSQRDKKWSDWLWRSIETYRVPRRLVGRESPGGKVPRRLFPVFRDREELPSSANLGASIEGALRASRYLIVVCSPNAAASRWVNEEIRAFKAMGGEERVLAVIVDGEPNASDTPHAGVPESFPEAIRYHVGRDGSLTRERTELSAADVRPDKDGRYNARLKILAGLLGVGFNELRRRERARYIRQVIIAIAAAIAIIAALAGTWLTQERAKERDVNRQLALKYEDRGKGLAEKNDEAGAALFFATANRLDPARSRRDSALLHIQNLILPHVIVGHGDEVTAVAFAPDGRRFLTMSNDGVVRVWDSNSGARLLELHVDHDTYSFRKAVFTRDGKRIFTALENARMWDSENGKPIAPPIPFKTVELGGGAVTESSYVDAAGLDPTEHKVVLKWNENFVQYWDADTSQPLGEAESHKGNWRDLAFLFQDDPVPLISADGKISARWDWNRPVQLSDAVTGKEIAGSVGQESRVVAMGFSPNGQLLATGGADGIANLWRIANGTVEAVRRSTRMIHPDIVSLVKFSPDGAFILTTSGDTAYLWNKSCQLEMVMPNPAKISVAIFSSDSQNILTGSEDGTAMLWKVSDRRALARSIVHDGWKDARLMILSPDGASVFTQWFPQTRIVGFTENFAQLTEPIESGQPHIRLWNVRTGAPLWNPVEYQPEITAATFSRDGTTIATIDETLMPRKAPPRFGENVPKKKTLRLWDAKNGAIIGDPYEISGTSGGDSSTPEVVIAFAADCSRLLLVHNESLPPTEPEGGLTPQSALQLLDAKTTHPLSPKLTIPGHIRSALFLHSGEILLSRGSEVLQWAPTASTPSPEAFVRTDDIQSIAVSPDEKTLLTVSTNSGRLWNMTDRQPKGSILDKPGGNAGFSPDNRLAITTGGGFAHLWDSQTGEPIGQPFTLGERSMFGTPPHLVEGRYLLATQPGGGSDFGIVWEKDLAWLLRDVSPGEVLSAAQLFSHRRINRNGDMEVIPEREWNAIRR